MATRAPPTAVSSCTLAAGSSCTSKFTSLCKSLTLVIGFSNNSVEVNLLEVCEKEKFGFDQINQETSETDSNAGKIAADLQSKTYKIFQRKR